MRFFPLKITFMDHTAYYKEKLSRVIFVFIIEEVFRSMDEESRRRVLENILVNIIQNTKNCEEADSSTNFEDSIIQNI